MKKCCALTLKPILIATLVSGVAGCNKASQDSNTEIAKASKAEAQTAPLNITKRELLEDTKNKVIFNKPYGEALSDLVKVQETITNQEIVVPKKINKQKVIKTKQNKTAYIPKADKVSTILSATTSAGVNKTESKPKIKKTKTIKKFSQTLDVAYETDMNEVDNKQAESSAIWYFLRYKLSSEYSGRLWVNVGKDLHESYKTTLNDTKLTLSKKGTKLSDKLTLSPSATLVLPTSDRSRKNEGLNYGIEVNPSFGYKITDKLRFTYLPRFAKNFHEYKTSKTNSMNTEYKSIQFFVLSYSFIEDWYLEPTLIYSNTWSYEGTQRDPAFMSILELGHNVNKNLLLATGISTSGSVYQTEKGPDSNIEIYDADKASIYGKFALTF